MTAFNKIYLIELWIIWVLKLIDFEAFNGGLKVPRFLSDGFVVCI